MISRECRAVRSRRAAALLTVALLAFAACARAPASLDAGLKAPAVAPRAFVFARDTFAFPNMIRARHDGEPGLYANYCFVLARAVRQFFVTARFDPEAPRLDHAGYVERVRRVVARAPWLPPLAAGERVVIPGYANLREFSRAEEIAVKDGLGPRFWTWVHWTNWRVTFPVTGHHQAAVAREIVEELGRGELVQLLITNWPKPELNHTVVAFGFREEAAGIVLDVSDPNDPSEPGLITFNRTRSRFEATRVYDTEPDVIRVFRMYYSRLL
jgi:hypothetical protein